jgi:hypothetical protein
MTHFVLLATLTPSNTCGEDGVWRGQGQGEIEGKHVRNVCILNRDGYRGRLSGVASDEYLRTYLTVFTPANLPNDFVILLITPIDSQGFVVPIITRTMYVDIGINSVVRLQYIHVSTQYSSPIPVSMWNMPE